MNPLPYLKGYPLSLQNKVLAMMEQGTLREYLQKKYPAQHDIRNDAALRDYTLKLKSRYMKKSAPVSKIIFDNKIQVVHAALGTHTYVARQQGRKLKSKNEIRIAAVFKVVPESLLRMIVVHELAHLKERDHNKAFYNLCKHMLPDYPQREFDLRVYLTQLEHNAPG